MMESNFLQIREQQRLSWDKFSPGWKKWDNFNMEFLSPMGDAIIDSLNLKDTDNVLDIATGTGEPGLTIAGIVNNGTVTGTDLSESMLSIAKAYAKNRNLTNYETVTADVCELPFADDSFDAISCRMGFMFFPDMQMAANEMYRVLKPGGKIAAAVWGAPAFNNWVTTIMSVIQKHIVLAPPAPGAPGMFRCAAPGLVEGLLEQAGFKNTSSKTITGTIDYQSFERYWEIMMDVGAPIVAAMAGAGDDVKEAIKLEAATLFGSKNSEGEGILEYGSLVISAQKL